MERKDTGKNVLIAFLVIIVMALVGLLAFNLGKENSNKPNDNIVDEGGNPEYKDGYLSLNDTRVKKIMDRFQFSSDYKYGNDWSSINIDVYIDRTLPERSYIGLILDNAEKLLKKEENCERQYLDDGAVDYECEYITYEDINKIYNDLTGKNAPKQNLWFDLVGLNYDSKLNIYKKVYANGGGGPGVEFYKKVTSASESDEYIYIYEDVIVESGHWSQHENGYDYIDTYYLIKPSKFKDGGMSNRNDWNIYDRDSYENDDHDFNFKQLCNDYSHLFETYKWTFKKGSNGEYLYVSVELANE